MLRCGPKHRCVSAADHRGMNSIASTPELIALIGIVFTLAGFVKGVVGLGLPTITMGLLSLVMAPSLVTNVWQIAARPGLAALTRRIAPMLAGVCAGVAVGAGWLGGGAIDGV